MIRCPYCDSVDLRETKNNPLDPSDDSLNCRRCGYIFRRYEAIRIETCYFCGTSEEHETAVEQEWVPSFRNESGESSSACLSCALKHLRYNPVDGQYYPIARFPSYSF